MLDRPRPRPSGIFELDDDELIQRVAPGGPEAVWAFIERFDPERALERLVELDVSAVCRHSRHYPERIRQLGDAPRVVFCTGSAERFAELAARPAATLVGTRKPTPYGSEVALTLGRGLTVAGITVVSGLALGIDALAHRGALECGAEPIAVLARGPEVAYPARHRGLYQRIREAGVVVSELPPGTPPFRWCFPARNRIMAALSAITVVVEAADPSGTLITVEFAQDLGRVIGAVPGPITSRVAAGANRLLREGAATIRCTEDILDEIFGAGQGPDGKPRVTEPPPAVRLEPRLRAVLDGVERGESAGEIAGRTGLPAGAVRAALGELELEGLIVPGAVGWYQRAASR
ncbi:MAG TPA: DNA-processing protein DprA [Thermoleophilaceae bacterium]|nr:DNA-processing protein DprA [Thermoleophilaceae bacterium]